MLSTLQQLTWINQLSAMLLRIDISGLRLCEHLRFCNLALLAAGYSRCNRGRLRSASRFHALNCGGMSNLFLSHRLMCLTRRRVGLSLTRQHFITNLLRGTVSQLCAILSPRR